VWLPHAAWGLVEVWYLRSCCQQDESREAQGAEAGEGDFDGLIDFLAERNTAVAPIKKMIRMLLIDRDAAARAPVQRKGVARYRATPLFPIKERESI